MRLARVVASGCASLLLMGCASRPPAPPTPPAPVVSKPPRVTPGSLESAPILGDLPARASRAGAGPLAIVTSGPLSEGERVGAFVEVPDGACLLAYGRASPAIEDIDLAAFAEEGNPLAIDERPDPHPTLLLCPPRAERIYVAVHAAAGQGLTVVAAQLVPRELAAAVGQAVEARGAAPRSPEAWPGLEEIVRTHRAAIGGRWEERRRVAMAVDSRAPSFVGLTVEEGGCTDAIVTPDDDVAALEVELLDADGRLVARARGSSSVRTITVCSSVGIEGTLQIRPHVGRGLVAVVTATSRGESAREALARPEVAWLASGEPLEATRAARERALGQAGYAPPTWSQTGQLQLGRRLTLPVTLPSRGGGCARVDVVAGAPLSLVDAAAWDDAGSLLATGDGEGGAALFVCGKAKARVDLGTRGRPGPFALTARPEAWQSRAFLAHPLAASRMLSRAAGPGVFVHRGTPGAVHQAALESTKRFSYEASVAPSTCLAVYVGVEGEGTGLELRLFDGETGEELDRAHGQVSGGVRACAAEAARVVRVEARATAGKLAAIIGERVIAADR